MRDSWFVIQKGIRIRSSDDRIRSKNVRGVREEKAGQRPWHGHHVCHTAQPALWPRVAHAPHTWARLAWLILLDKIAPLPSPSNDFSFLHFQTTLKNIKLKILQISSWFSFSYLDHNSLIRTRNWVIQKPKLLVLKRATNPKHLHSHLSSLFSAVHQSQSEIWVCKCFNFFLLSLLIISLIFLFDWWKIIWMMLTHMLGLYDWLFCWVLVLNLIWVYFTKTWHILKLILEITYMLCLMTFSRFNFMI